MPRTAQYIHSVFRLVEHENVVSESTTSKPVNLRIVGSSPPSNLTLLQTQNLTLAVEGNDVLKDGLIVAGTLHLGHSCSKGLANKFPWWDEHFGDFKKAPWAPKTFRSLFVNV